MNFNESIMWKEINETPRIFSEILTENKEVMSKVVAQIKKGKATNFVAAARGTSDHALIFFKYVLEVNSNYTVGLSAPSVVTLYNGKINYSNSVVIGCSQSGKAADVLEIIKKGNEQGAITIAVTNDRNSPMAKEAKFHLYCSAGLETSVAATKTFSSQLFLLLWLASELSNHKENILHLKHLDSEITKIMPQIDELTTKYANKFKNMQSGFVISRGLTYAIALEASLKLQETCYIQMKGYAGSDFYHGPVAQLHENDLAIVLAQSGIMEPDAIKMIDKLKAVNATTVVISDKQELLNGTYNIKIENTGCELTIPFIYAIAVQLIALELVLAKGIDPDKSDVIAKITVTK